MENKFINLDTEFQKWKSSHDFIDGIGEPREPDAEEGWDGALEAFLDQIHDKEEFETQDEKRYSFRDLIEIISQIKNKYD